MFKCRLSQRVEPDAGLVRLPKDPKGELISSIWISALDETFLTGESNKAPNTKPNDTLRRCLLSFWYSRVSLTN